MSDILASLGVDINADLGNLLQQTVQNPSDFSISDNTWITVGKETMYKASTPWTPDNNGTTNLSTKVVLHPGATLNRISVEQRKKYRGSGTYLLVSGTMRNVKMDISILHDGSWVSMLDYFKYLAGNPALSDADMENTLGNMRMNFTQPQTLLFQQFGADEQAYAELTAMLLANGFNENQSQNDNVLQVLSSDAGVPLTGFQVGKMNRAESRPHGKKIAGTDRVHEGQGFLDFVDAQVSKYINTSKIAGIMAQLETARNTHRASLTEEQMSAISESLDSHRQMISNISQRGTGWSGAQREVEVDDLLQEVTEKNVFWSQRAPIGRFNLSIAGVDTPVSLWRDRTNDEGAETTAAAPKEPVSNPFAGVETP